MSIVTTQNQKPDKAFRPETAVGEVKERRSSQISPSVDSYQVDVLGQLRANVAKIQELQGRLRFTMNEISSLIKKR